MIEVPDSAKAMVSESGFEAIERLPSGHCAHIWANDSLVLKVPFQGEEISSGCSFMCHLSHFDCAPKVHHVDRASGCMIMDRVQPGTMLRDVNLSEVEKLDVWRELVLEIRSAACIGHSTVRQDLIELRDFVDLSDPLAEYLVESQSASDSVILHGDLHHENILLGPTRWFVIDAKGAFGDPAFEGAAYVRNPIPWISGYSAECAEGRVREVAKALTVDPFRVWGWTVVTIREDMPEPDTHWFQVLKALYESAPIFGAERFVGPLT